MTSRYRRDKRLLACLRQLSFVGRRPPGDRASRSRCGHCRRPGSARRRSSSDQGRSRHRSRNRRHITGIRHRYILPAAHPPGAPTIGTASRRPGRRQGIAGGRSNQRRQRRNQSGENRFHQKSPQKIPYSVGRPPNARPVVMMGHPQNDPQTPVRAMARPEPGQSGEISSEIGLLYRRMMLSTPC